MLKHKRALSRDTLFSLRALLARFSKNNYQSEILFFVSFAINQIKGSVSKGSVGVSRIFYRQFKTCFLGCALRK